MRQVPDAGGLVIAADQARALRSRQLRCDHQASASRCPTPDDADASERIDEFRRDRQVVAVQFRKVWTFLAVRWSVRSQRTSNFSFSLRRRIWAFRARQQAPGNH